MAPYSLEQNRVGLRLIDRPSGTLNPRPAFSTPAPKAIQQNSIQRLVQNLAGAGDVAPGALDGLAGREKETGGEQQGDQAHGVILRNGRPQGRPRQAARARSSAAAARPRRSPETSRKERQSKAPAPPGRGGGVAVILCDLCYGWRARGPAPERETSERAFALQPLADQLARAPNRFGLLAGSLLGRLLIELPALHLPEGAFPLHFLFQRAQRLLDVVVADNDLDQG